MGAFNSCRIVNKTVDKIISNKKMSTKLLTKSRGDITLSLTMEYDTQYRAWNENKPHKSPTAFSKPLGFSMPDCDSSSSAYDSQTIIDIISIRHSCLDALVDILRDLKDFHRRPNLLAGTLSQGNNEGY